MTVLRGACLAAILLSGVRFADAQPGYVGSGEFSAYTGFISGIGTHPNVGGSAGYTFAKYGLFLLDTTFSPLGSSTVRTHSQEIIRQSRLYDFNAMFHVQIPVKNRWAPYGIIGAGILYSRFQSAARDSASVYYGGKTETNFGFDTGGGVRYYIRDEWGVRAETRVIISNHTYTGITFGIFYQTQGDN